MISLDDYRIFPNMACFCKLMAQNWHKSFALVRVVIFSCGQYYDYYNLKYM